MPSDVQVSTKHSRCTKAVISCYESDPIIKQLVSALNGLGCPFRLSRHVSCEPCPSGLKGTYDPSSNQVVVCENALPFINKKKDVCQTLAHELVHMFDACRAKYDSNNFKHLACTEIRAASLVSCRSVTYGTPQHRGCTRNTATRSVQFVLNHDKETELNPESLVEEVFDCCYKDTSPQS